MIGGWFCFIHRGYNCNVTERPMCRSARESTEPLPIKTRHAPRYVIPTAALAEWRNPPRGRKYQHKVKSATREDSSTPFHYTRNDIIGGRFCFIHRGCNLPRSGTAHRPFPTYFNGRIHMNNVGCSNNCQLSIVNCPFFPPFPTVRLGMSTITQAPQNRSGGPGL